MKIPTGCHSLKWKSKSKEKLVLLPSKKRSISRREGELVWISSCHVMVFCKFIFLKCTATKYTIQVDTENKILKPYTDISPVVMLSCEKVVNTSTSLDTLLSWSRWEMLSEWRPHSPTTGSIQAGPFPSPHIHRLIRDSLIKGNIPKRWKKGSNA